MIAVVDYRKGNLKSVERGIIAAGGDARITTDPALIAGADGIVLPGVGSFADAAASMDELGQMPLIRDRIVAGVPFLGICLGLHLMFEEGVEGSAPEEEGSAPEEEVRTHLEEGEEPTHLEEERTPTHFARGLALLPGVVGALPKTGADGRMYKVPHVGWNSIEFLPDRPFSPLFDGIPSGEYFYFTHSYIAPDTPSTKATTAHSTTFPSVVAYRDAAFGVQFHPEKSSDAGALVLRNFVRIVKGA